MAQYNARKVAQLVAEFEAQLDAAAKNEDWDAWDSIKDALYNLARYRMVTKPAYESATQDEYIQSQY